MNTALKKIERYYDSHEVEGEEMGQSNVHFENIHYLTSLLQWLYRDQPVYVIGELNLYHTANPREVPLCPDIMVVKGLDPHLFQDRDMSSYYIGVDGPAPTLVMEIASPKTWKVDLETKPQQYAGLGVQEYFAFDPNVKPVWTKEWRKRGRLAGWHLEGGEMVPLSTNEQGQLWSEECESGLVVAGRSLELYDREGRLRLTETQTQYAEKLRERERAEGLSRRAEAEYIEKLRERERAEGLSRRAERLADFLRQQGFDPDNLK